MADKTPLAVQNDKGLHQQAFGFVHHLIGRASQT